MPNYSQFNFFEFTEDEQSLYCNTVFEIFNSRLNNKVNFPNYWGVLDSSEEDSLNSRYVLPGELSTYSPGTVRSAFLFQSDIEIFAGKHPGEDPCVYVTLALLQLLYYPAILPDLPEHLTSIEVGFITRDIREITCTVLDSMFLWEQQNHESDEKQHENEHLQTFLEGFKYARAEAFKDWN